MNLQELSDKLQSHIQGRSYNGNLTYYARKSIEQGRSNYPVANLIEYCEGCGIKLIMTDMATEERFNPRTILEVHQVIVLLMRRYDIDCQLIYRKTAIHYSKPKEEMSGNKFNTSLSVKTLLAVCDVIHCSLSFE